MIKYPVKENILSGSNYDEIRKQVMNLFKTIKSRTKRKPYIRSSYFGKEKIFFDFFWPHLHDKHHKERVKRLKFFVAAIELIKNSRNHPISFVNPNNKREILYRFAGITRDDHKFYVQIKENIRSKNKYFMSCFPI